MKERNEWTIRWIRKNSFVFYLKKKKMQTLREIWIWYSISLYIEKGKFHKSIFPEDFKLHFHFQIHCAVKLCDIQKFVQMKVFFYLYVIKFALSIWNFLHLTIVLNTTCCIFGPKFTSTDHFFAVKAAEMASKWVFDVSTFYFRIQILLMLMKWKRQLFLPRSNWSSLSPKDCVALPLNNTKTNGFSFLKWNRIEEKSWK